MVRKNPELFSSSGDQQEQPFVQVNADHSIWTLMRPIAAPLKRCAELLGVDLATIQEAAVDIEPYVRVDGTKVWSLMQLERKLRPDAYGRVRGGYIARRRPHAGGASQDEHDGQPLLLLRLN